MARPRDFIEEDVLQKAICVFWRKGYKGTSMQDLVDGLGISRSSMYDTFTDKHTLYVKALETYQKKSNQQLCDIFENAPSAKAAIKQLFELTINDILNDGEHKGCFLVNTEIEVSHKEDVKDLVSQSVSILENAFYQTILRGQENGEIGERHDALALSRLMSNIIKGLQVSAKTITDKTYFDGIIKATLAILD
jgi:TetR/AcrR family transcriptional repressor of nem operon